MSSALLTGLLVFTTAAVVVAMFYVMWWERRSPRTGLVAIFAGGVLACWAGATAALAARGFYLPRDATSLPPVAIQLGIALAALALFLTASPSLRSLLTRQTHLIRLNLWRLAGVVFLMLMITGQAPALWALPTGVGDIVVGVTAFWVASRLERPGGVKLAVAFNIFGMLDLVVAISLGVATNPGPLQVFHPTPTSDLVTRFPLALVPGFLVPLAFMLHIVSLWQLSGRSWAHPAASPSTR